MILFLWTMWWGLGVMWALHVWRKEFDVGFGTLLLVIMTSAIVGPMMALIWEWCRWVERRSRRAPRVIWERKKR